MVAPVNTVLPTITGTVAVASTLTLSNGTWTGTPSSYAYAWYADGVAIAGQIASTLVVPRTNIGAVLKGRVTATNGDGSTAADSANTIAVPTTLVVEDGTAKANADSYCSIADADTYFDVRGDTTWSALTDAAKEAALRKATDYLVGRYRLQWKGYRHTATQALDWPRDWVYREPYASGAVGIYPFLVENDTVPVEVKNACASLALRASTVTLLADQERAVTSETVGPISVTYDRASSQTTVYKEIDAMLVPYLNGAGGVEMVRV